MVIPLAIVTNVSSFAPCAELKVKLPKNHDIDHCIEIPSHGKYYKAVEVDEIFKGHHSLPEE